MPVAPGIARLLAQAAAAEPRGIEVLSVAEARARGGSVAVVSGPFEDVSVPFEDVSEVRDVVIDVDPRVAARLYRPASLTLPLLVYFNGGGWVVGSVALSDSFCRSLANAFGCAVLSADRARAGISRRSCRSWRAREAVRGSRCSSSTSRSPITTWPARRTEPTRRVSASHAPAWNGSGTTTRQSARAAGVTVTHLDYPGMVHAFIGWTSVVPTGARAMKEVGAELRRALR